MARKKGLGSGLQSIFADNSLDIGIMGTDAVIGGEKSMLRVTHIEPKKSQPRKYFDKEALAELADSVAKLGVIQPLVVRALPNGYYQIIAGERRWRAAKMAGLDMVPVVIKNVDDLTAAEITMVENLQREDLNPVEEARGYKYLIENYALTQEEISGRVAKSRPVVANALRLLSLPEDVLKLIEHNEITPGHARAILSLDGPEEQSKLAQKIIKNSMSVRETERTVRALKAEPLQAKEHESTPPDKKIEQMYIKTLQNKISGMFGRKIVINATRKRGEQSGKLEIEYKNNNELEEIIKALCGGKNIDEIMR